ncbi:hypothetical protein [Methylobacterium dankookense]|jgi:hypothetical protein|uniref:Uncharacterized protein n=1 Tax=Methylobacterium dankookense TaxID=560405 RepID=A0A564FZ58_9HYPH|nr:hypothetical protein [Methylobacterium dankookense]GJD54333.1 hypothetical protein IFDJLNFL_0204 [Methylobacterium dankookense]VUF13028.1 hypothetical protein MTDSW087_02726 [Methylobacterium dankookense]
MSHPAPDALARAREAVARYLPADPDASRFARGLRAYARCQDACQERAAGEPECRDSCARAQAAMRRKG